MATRSQLISYLRDCYRSDNRESSLANLLHSRNRHVRFFEGDEVGISGTIEKIPLPEKVAKTVQKDAFQYRRDKSLVYAVFPVVGTRRELSALGKVLCAPLAFFPAEILESEKGWFLTPEFDEITWNYPVLSSIAALDGADDSALSKSLNQLGTPPWPKEQVHTLAALFADLLPSIEFEQLAQFPDLVDKHTVESFLAKQKLRCVPAAAMALLPNSPNTRGVLYELETLADEKEHSPPLVALLDDDYTSQPRIRAARCAAPTTLSSAQQHVANICRSLPISLVIGPPGTGKSHTIASVAVDHLANAQSVLVACQTDQAVDVVGDKIDELIGETAGVVRAGRKKYARKLNSHLASLLQDSIDNPINQPSSRSIRRSLKRLERKTALLGTDIANGFDNEVDWARANARESSGLIERISRDFSIWLSDWKLRQFDGWQVVDQLKALNIEFSAFCKSLAIICLEERTRKLLKKRRKTLTDFSQAVRARSDGKQQKLFKQIDFSALLHALPVWLCKLADLSNVLPLKKELFDLAIIDEATQCDIASCLPLLQRAKRVAIVGDPNQLRHISFLPEQRLLSFSQEHSLDEVQQQKFHFRDNSILDACNQALQSQQQVAFLNEHFRCPPDIIRFSNEKFYQNRLSVMRSLPWQSNESNINLIHSEGKRKKNGHNESEAKLVIDSVRQIMDGCQAKTRPDYNLVPTIGVLSPFRKQVDFLTKLFDREFSLAELLRHDLLVGTAHTFQGEERDVMMISMALDDESHPSSFQFLENPNLLNVSITRAKQMQNVILSFKPGDIGTDRLLRQFLDDAARSDHQATSAVELNSIFQQEVCDALRATDVEIWTSYSVASVTIDVIAKLGDRFLGIDLIGQQEGHGDSLEPERYLTLKRAGLPIYPVSYRQWLTNRPSIIQRILSALES